MSYMTAPQDYTPRGFTAQEWQARVDLAACYRLVAHYGWTDEIHNHITVKIPGSDHLLINPYGLAYVEIRASNLVKIDLEGNRLDESFAKINQTGFVIHSAVHAARPDVQCVLHTHAPNSTAVSCLAVGFVPMTEDGYSFYRRVGTHAFEGQALDLDARARLAADLGPENHTLLLRNHGILTTGRSVAEAFTRHYRFERAAEVQLKAQATGQALSQVSEAVMLRTRSQYESGNDGSTAAYPSWPAHLRLLDRLDPSYRQ